MAMALCALKCVGALALVMLKYAMLLQQDMKG